jgi:hypothetical protein
MDYRTLILEAYALAKTHKYLQWFAVFPMFSLIVLDSIYMIVRYGHLVVDDVYSELEMLIVSLYSTGSPLFTLGAIVVGFSLVIQLLFAVFFEGSLIAMVHRIIQAGNKPVRSSMGIMYGVKVYLRLVQLHGVLSIFNPFFVYIGMFLLKKYSLDMYELLLVPAIVIWGITALIKFGTLFSDYILVIGGGNVVGSIKKSFSLIFYNLQETVVLALAIGLIVLRTVVNFVLLFIIPTAVVWLIHNFLGFIPNHIVMWIIGILVAILYYYTIRVASFIYVFTSAVFVKSYYIFIEVTQRELEYIPD